MFERRLFFHIDWALLTALLAIVCIGIAMIYSTTYVLTADGGHAGPQVRTQIYALVLGLCALLVFLAIDYRMLAEHSLFLYFGLAGLLSGVIFKQIWKQVSDAEDAPSALKSEYRMREVVIAAALQGAIFAATKAAIDRAGARGFTKLTGKWPGD